MVSNLKDSMSEIQKTLVINDTRDRLVKCSQRPAAFSRYRGRRRVIILGICRNSDMARWSLNAISPASC